MSMWTISRIDEDDYGCEERMPGEPLMVLVTIESDDGRQCRFQCPEDRITDQNLNEGDEWPEDVDEPDLEAERIERQSDWMENYYRAVEEMEEEG